jgi:protein-arginine kinase
MGIINNTELETVNRLIYEMQPAALISNAGRSLDAQARDVLRAQLVREKLGDRKSN